MFVEHFLIHQRKVKGCVCFQNGQHTERARVCVCVSASRTRITEM